MAMHVSAAATRRAAAANGTSMSAFASRCASAFRCASSYASSAPGASSFAPDASASRSSASASRGDSISRSSASAGRSASASRSPPPPPDPNLQIPFSLFLLIFCPRLFIPLQTPWNPPNHSPSPASPDPPHPSASTPPPSTPSDCAASSTSSTATSELHSALDCLGLSADPEDVASIISSHVQPGCNGLGFEEFQDLHRNLGDALFGDSLDDDQETEKEDMVEAFKVFDVDGDGFSSAKKLQTVLGKLQRTLLDVGDERMQAKTSCGVVVVSEVLTRRTGALQWQHWWWCRAYECGSSGRKGSLL